MVRAERNRLTNSEPANADSEAAVDSHTLRRLLDGIAVDRASTGRAAISEALETLCSIALELELTERRIGSGSAPGELLGATAIVGLLGFGAGLFLLREVLLATPTGLIGAFIPLWWIRRGHGRKLSRFKSQLPDTVGLLASSVRSGHSLPQALEHVAADAPEPTKEAFLLVGREIALGASQEDALERLSERYPSDDLKLIVAAINVQHQIGGSLAKILDSISETIRERIRIEGDIKALTAPQRVSAYVLCGLPVFVTLGLLLIGPDYVGPLFQPGPLRYALFSAISLVILGFLVMRAMTKIDV